MVVKLLMKMEESVYSSKQLSVKDGEVIYSLYEEQYFFPPLIAAALMKSLHTWGDDSGAKHRATYWTWLENGSQDSRPVQ